MEIQKVKIEPFMMIGIETRTINKGNVAKEKIGGLWQRLLNEKLIDQIPNKEDNSIYSVYCEYEGDHTKPYTTILGCKVNSLSSIPEGMVGKSFDGGTYIKSTTKGDLMEEIVINHWVNIWQSDWDRAYSADFEVYGEKAQNPKDAEVEFYVAINE
ncbi:GyrI-like domain-containing protein [Marinigracilibium pacificum]|uniref:AraC family transcriptional regulator n=1 Tax=Marinigracilibium pacificum TaxID=2729599 RepID=A0A848ITB9_9BACT|nr:GyrI-like domain-containing protein [Marinigracilibium pacificum]NMM47713.1 AraC family transcriptional regulator [Marinigracilibium pacificum]